MVFEETEAGIGKGATGFISPAIDLVYEMKPAVGGNGTILHPRTPVISERQHPCLSYCGMISWHQLIVAFAFQAVGDNHMTFQEQIEQAQKSHGAWKQRLNAAISSGSSEFQVSHLHADNHCDFGKWFYALPQAVRGTAQGMKIQKLHADFHVEAAKILGLALKGRTEEATQLLETGGNYSSISGKLYLALSQWKDTV